MKHTLLVLQLLCLFLLCSCDKDKDPAKDPTLPEATRLGKNTMGFTLEDGQVWIPYFKCGMGQDPCGKYSARVSHPFASPDGIDFRFTRDNGKGSSSSLFIYSTSGTVTGIGDKVDSLHIVFLAYDNGKREEYGFPLGGSHFTVTRFDKAARIISGEFHLILKEYGGGKTITLSNGRFDSRFQACECDW